MMKENNIAHDLPTAKDSLIEKIESVIGQRDFPSKDHIFRIEQPISRINPLKWLQQQNHDVKTYWSGRDGQYEMAGIGYADVISGDTLEGYDFVFDQMRSRLNPEFRNLRYFGGFQFDGNGGKDTVWQNFGAFRFLVPQVEVMRDGKGTKLAINIKDHHSTKHHYDSINELIGKIKYNPDFIFPNQAKPISRIDVPDKNSWFQNIKKAKVLFHQRDLEKIVLARRSEFDFSDRIAANQLIAQLKSASPNAFHFYFQPKEGVVFLGASPELLFRREDKNIYSEALAGTCPRGKNEDEDKKLENDLLNSKKDCYEHALVCQYIEKAMRRLSDDLITDETISIMKSKKVQHLYKKFQGILKENHNDSNLISALHPTPAVGGLPKEKALKTREEIEGFNRGWYAAPIGWVGADSAEFAVGIRSGLVSQNRLYLYSGAGIVPESDPELEWQELEHKASQFLKLFQD